MDKLVQKILRLEGRGDIIPISAPDIRATRTGQVSLLRSFYFHLRASGLRPKTIKDYLHRLSYLANLASRLDKDMSDVTTEEIKEYIIKVLDTVKPISINGRIKIWHLAYDYWLHEGLAKHDPTVGIRKLREETVVKRPISPKQLELLLGSFGKSFAQQRNKMMVMTAVDTCCRVGELVKIRLPDLDLDDGIVVLRHTKSHRDRAVPVTSQVVKRLYNYIYRYRKDIPGEHLFCRQDGAPLEIDRLRKVLVEQSKLLGWPRPIGPHCLRRSGAHYLHEAGMSVELLRRILGHADIRTTQSYINYDDARTLKDTKERLSVFNRIGVA